MTEIEFLKARLDELERWYGVGEFEEVDSARGPGWGVRYCGICGEGGWEGRESVTEEGAYKHLDDHHEREFVVAQIAAQRKIIELHLVFEYHQTKTAWREKRTYLHCGTCGDPQGWDQTPPVDWPCPTLLALLQPFADHPDFDPDWRDA